MTSSVLQGFAHTRQILLLRIFNFSYSILRCCIEILQITNHRFYSFVYNLKYEYSYITRLFCLYKTQNPGFFRFNDILISNEPRKLWVVLIGRNKWPITFFWTLQPPLSVMASLTLGSSRWIIHLQSKTTCNAMFSSHIPLFSSTAYNEVKLLTELTKNKTAFAILAVCTFSC